jgi:hypothetical protein
MKYDIPHNVSICFAGDDMCANRQLNLSNQHVDVLDKLKLKAKTDFVSTPTFCGWCLTPSGIYKKPQLVYERLCIAIEKDNLLKCIDNYAIEVSYAYLMGELAHMYMGPEELDNHYQCVRIIIRNKHLLKSGIRCLFENTI